MSFSIKVSKKSGDRTDVIASRTWPQSKITIGRGEECTLVLEDQKKHVSRVHVELKVPREGRKRYTGTLTSINDVGVELEVDRLPVTVRFDEIEKARLAPENAGPMRR